jgi:hypothetical protein
LDPNTSRRDAPSAAPGRTPHVSDIRPMIWAPIARRAECRTTPDPLTALPVTR